MRLIFLFLVSTFSLLAAQSQPAPSSLSTLDKEIYWKYHHTASVGYRRDRQLFQQPSSKEAFKHRNSLELLLGSHLEAGHFIAYLRGKYGWLLDGRFDQAIEPSPYMVPFPISVDGLSLGAGYSADVLGAFGLHFQLLSGSDLAISFFPLGGYQYSHLMNFPRGEKEVSLTSSSPFSFASVSVPDPNQQDWFGPFAEARLRFLFWEKMECLLFYQYHRPSMRSKLKEEIDVYLLASPSTAAAIELFTVNSIYKARSATKQLAGIELRYHPPSGWNFGVRFEGSSAWSHKARYFVHTKKDQYVVLPTGLTKTSESTSATIHWVCYEVAISLGYQF